MPKNQKTLQRELFDTLQGYGFDPKVLNSSGKQVPVPEEGDVFQFHFHHDGVDYGTVTVTIDGLHQLIIYFPDNIADSPKSSHETDELTWTELLKMMKRFAFKKQLSFKLKNTDKLSNDMAKRHHTAINEAWSGNRHFSGNPDIIPEVKLVIQHSRALGEGEQRFRNIEKIFVENAQGERLLLPTRRLSAAKAHARNISEGGYPNDDRGRHITQVSEELDTLTGFVRATKTGTINEAAQGLVDEAVRHFQDLKKRLKSLAGRRGFREYFENWQPAIMEEQGDEGVDQLFVRETLDPRIESAMPILSRLHKQLQDRHRPMTELHEFESWADSILEDNSVLKPHTRKQIDDLAKLVGPNSEALPYGADGNNVKGRLDDIIENDDLVVQLTMKSRKDPDADARPFIRTWLKNHEHDLYDEVMSDEVEPDDPVIEPKKPSPPPAGAAGGLPPPPPPPLAEDDLSSIRKLSGIQK